MTADHESFEELAAGYALSALEPADEQAFLDHLAGCDRCAAVLADFSDVAADIAVTSAGDDVPAGLWERIRTEARATPPERASIVLPDVVAARENAANAAAVGTGDSVDTHHAVALDHTDASTSPVPAGTGSATVVDLEEHRRWYRQPVWLAAAAAAVVIAAVGTVVGVTAGGGGGQSQTARLAADCQVDPGCHLVPLQGAGARTVSGYVAVRGATVQVASSRLPVLSPAAQYVLWQMPPSGKPVAVVGFTVTSATQGHRVAVHRLVFPYADTATFAVSQERAGPLPSAPTTTSLYLGSV